MVTQLPWHGPMKTLLPRHGLVVRKQRIFLSERVSWVGGSGWRVVWGCGWDREIGVGCKRHVAKDTACGGLEDVLRGNLCNIHPRAKFLLLETLLFTFQIQ